MFTRFNWNKDIKNPLLMGWNGPATQAKIKQDMFSLIEVGYGLKTPNLDDVEVSLKRLHAKAATEATKSAKRSIEQTGFLVSSLDVPPTFYPLQDCCHHVPPPIVASTNEVGLLGLNVLHNNKDPQSSKDIIPAHPYAHIHPETTPMCALLRHRWSLLGAMGHDGHDRFLTM